MNFDIFDLETFAPSFLKIADKSGKIVSFEFNRAQKHIHNLLEDQKKRLGYVRALILKGRQQGCSTYVQARFYHTILTRKGTQAFILTHMSDATQSLFGITKRYNDYLPPGLAPSPSKKSHNRLEYDRLGSGYRVGTAGSKNVGRSMTNQLLHMSEAAFYDNITKLAQGIEQTVSDESGTEKIKESTANGTDNAFYSAWQDAIAGKSEYIAIFVPWYWQDEYKKNAENLQLTDNEEDWLQAYSSDGLTIEHLAWRRAKLADFDGTQEERSRKFDQEYPFSSEDAFQNSITDTFITPDLVRLARKRTIETEAALVVGVDPARFGDDASAIIRRRGRCAYKLETYKKLDTMELAAKVRQIIEQEHPSRVFIDSIGVGGGVVDRLNELGFGDIVVGVNVAHKSHIPDKFRNMRAQLWAECKAWLMSEALCDIPDDLSLQNELCALGYYYDTQGRLCIESKDVAKKRGVKSPDKAEALIMTFYAGNNPLNAGNYYNPAPAGAAAGLI